MNLPRKKILVLASTFPRWKNDTTPPFVYDLEKRLTKDFIITVLAPHSNLAKKNEKQDNLIIQRFQYFWPASLQKLSYEGGILPNLKKNPILYLQIFPFLFFEFIAAIQYVRKEKVQFIHAHWLIPQGIIAYAIKKITNIPYLLTIHGGDIYGLQNPILFALRKLVIKNAKEITAVSESIKQELLIKYAKNIPVTVISMGVDASIFTKKKYDRSLKKVYDIQGPFLLYVGRLAEKKGITYLIRALPQVLQSYPKTKLLIVGEGPLAKELYSLTERLHIQKNVIFVGAISHHELPKFYATADLFIGPSIQTQDGDREGFGLTFAEAILSKCIVIASNSGGITDIITDKKTGFLVQEKNSLDITKKIKQVLSHKTLTTKIKQYAYSTIYKNFEWKYITKKYNSLYRRIL